MRCRCGFASIPSLPEHTPLIFPYPKSPAPSRELLVLPSTSNKAKYDVDKLKASVRTCFEGRDTQCVSMSHMDLPMLQGALPGRRSWPVQW